MRTSLAPFRLEVTQSSQQANPVREIGPRYRQVNPSTDPDWQGNRQANPSTDPGWQGNRQVNPSTDPDWQGNRQANPSTDPGWQGNRQANPSTDPGGKATDKSIQVPIQAGKATDKSNLQSRRAGKKRIPYEIANVVNVTADLPIPFTGLGGMSLPFSSCSHLYSDVCSP